MEYIILPPECNDSALTNTQQCFKKRVYWRKGVVWISHVIQGTACDVCSISNARTTRNKVQFQWVELSWGQLTSKLSVSASITKLIVFVAATLQRTSTNLICLGHLGENSWDKTQNSKSTRFLNILCQLLKIMQFRQVGFDARFEVRFDAVP